MSDEAAAKVAAASSDEDFAQALEEAAAAEQAAGISDNQDGVDITPIEDKPAVEEPTKPTEPEGEEGKEEPKPEGFSENHDIHATLEEEAKPKEGKEEPPKADSNAPRYLQDAKNLAEKWDDLTEGERHDKAKNLAKARPHTFNQLAKELGTTPELLLEQNELDVTDLTEAGEGAVEIDPEKIAKEAEDRAYRRLKAEQANSTEGKEAARDRFMAEVKSFAQHNKLSKEDTQALTSLDGDLFKSFERFKLDPETGQPLSVKGRLKLAISLDPTVKNALIKSGAVRDAKRMIAGVNAALPQAGNPSKPTPKSHDEVANANDEDFSKSMDTVSSQGVVPIKF